MEHQQHVPPEGEGKTKANAASPPGASRTTAPALEVDTVTSSPSSPKVNLASKLSPRTMRTFSPRVQLGSKISRLAAKFDGPASPSHSSVSSTSSPRSPHPIRVDQAQLSQPQPAQPPQVSPNGSTRRGRFLHSTENVDDDPATPISVSTPRSDSGSDGGRTRSHSDPSQYQATIDALTKANLKLRRQLEELEKKHPDEDNAVNERARADGLQTEVDRLVRELSSKDQLISALRAEVGELHSSVNETKAAKDRTESELKGIAQSLGEEKERGQALSQQLEQMTEQMQALRDQVASQQHEPEAEDDTEAPTASPEEEVESHQGTPGPVATTEGVKETARDQKAKDDDNAPTQGGGEEETLATVVETQAATRANIQEQVGSGDAQSPMTVSKPACEDTSASSSAVPTPPPPPPAPASSNAILMANRQRGATIAGGNDAVSPRSLRRARTRTATLSATRKRNISFQASSRSRGATVSKGSNPDMSADMASLLAEIRNVGGRGNNDDKPDRRKRTQSANFYDVPVHYGANAHDFSLPRRATVEELLAMACDHWDLAATEYEIMDANNAIICRTRKVRPLTRHTGFTHLTVVPKSVPSACNYMVENLVGEVGDGDKKDLRGRMREEIRSLEKENERNRPPGPTPRKTSVILRAVVEGSDTASPIGVTSPTRLGDHLHNIDVHRAPPARAGVARSKSATISSGAPPPPPPPPPPPSGGSGPSLEVPVGPGGRSKSVGSSMEGRPSGPVSRPSLSDSITNFRRDTLQKIDLQSITAKKEKTVKLSTVADMMTSLTRMMRAVKKDDPEEEEHVQAVEEEEEKSGEWSEDDQF